MTNARKIMDAFERRVEEHNTVGASEALESSVDTDRFYRLASCITMIETGEEKYVEVTFRSPVAELEGLEDSYDYTVAAGEEAPHQYNKMGMPRKDLLTMHQIAFVVWSLASGDVYE